jgi:hypothetical protein
MQKTMKNAKDFYQPVFGAQHRISQKINLIPKQQG